MIAVFHAADGRTTASFAFRILIVHLCIYCPPFKHSEMVFREWCRALNMLLDRHDPHAVTIVLALDDVILQWNALVFINQVAGATAVN